MTISCCHPVQHRDSSTNALITSLLITGSFALIELLFGYLSNSLALFSDAGHMVGDALILGIAACAASWARKPTTSRHTYGFSRIEVIVAGLSGLFLWVIVIGVAIEAIRRFTHPPVVSAPMVIIVASLGLIANGIIMWRLHRGHKTFNIRAALLHVLGDLLGSVMALFSGVVIYFTGWSLIDPILSLLICVFILLSSINLLKQTFHVLMEGVPAHLSIEDIRDAIQQVEHVRDIDDLHLWTLSSQHLLTIHIIIDDLKYWSQILNHIKKTLMSRFQLDHVTIQPEIVEQQD